MSTVAELSARVEKLEKMILGMKKEIGTLRNGEPVTIEPGECVKGQDPVDCPFAGTYRYQKGCRGAACKRANSEYYNKGGTRDKAKGGTTTPVTVAKKGVPLKVTAKKAAPAAKAPAKKGLLKRA